MSDQKPTIIYPPGLQFWFMKQRPQQVCLELAKLGYKVIYGEHLSGINRIYQAATGPYLRQSDEHENMYLCYNIYRYVMNHPDETIIIYATSGSGHAWTDLIPYHSFIFDEVDNFPANEAASTVACKKANRIIYSAKSLREIIDSRREKFPEITPDARFAPNGCDFDHWDFPLKQEDNYAPPYKIVYIGALSAWLDFQLILSVVRNIDVNCEFWFIGARFDSGPSLEKVQRLVGMSNVVAIPHVPYKDLPFLTEDADVLWIPFDVTDAIIPMGDNKMGPVSLITQHTNPIKLYEYLATGKPIIYTEMDAITEFTQDLDMDQYNLRCVKNNAECINAIKDFTDFFEQGNIRDKAMNNKALARENTWTKTAQVFHETIQDLLTSDIENENNMKNELCKNRILRDGPDSSKFTTIQEPTKPVSLLED